VLILSIAVAGIYYIGTEKLIEASVGEIQGEGLRNFAINDDSYLLNSSWGFDNGFYLFIVSILLTVIAFILEFKNIFLSKKDS
jgi:hypothetical protein